MQSLNLIGYVESFTEKLRVELLISEIYTTLLEATVLIEECRKEYNQTRLHSSLDYRSPAPQAILADLMSAILTWELVQ